MLDKLDESGVDVFAYMRVFIYDDHNRLNFALKSNDDERRELERRVKLLKNHPAIFGYYIGDEEPQTASDKLRWHTDIISTKDFENPTFYVDWHGSDHGVFMHNASTDIMGIDHYGYTFVGWFTDPRTKVNRVTTFTFTKPDVVYAKWEKNSEEPINPNDEIMGKDTCYLTDEETKIRTEIIKEREKAYIDGFGYATPSKAKTIIVDSDGDVNKMVGTMD